MDKCQWCDKITQTIPMISAVELPMICVTCGSKVKSLGYQDLKSIFLKYNQINQIKDIIKRSEDWCLDQFNGLTEGQVCISAMKDIKRILKD